MNVAVENKPQLFDTNTREINPYWIDTAQPLKIPVNPLHYHAHKLQLLLARMDRQAENNPAQFNSGNYLKILTEFTSTTEAINKGASSIDEIHESGSVDPDRHDAAAEEMGDTTSAGMDIGISADNPFAG